MANEKQYSLKQVRQAWGAGRYSAEDSTPLGIRQFDNFRLLDRKHGRFFRFVLVGPDGKEVICVADQTYGDAWQRVMEARVEDGLRAGDAPQGGYFLRCLGEMVPQPPP